MLLVTSCNQNDLTLNSDRTYPTIYKRLDQKTLNQLRTSFATTNPFLCTTITDFGFCGTTEDYITAPYPARIPNLNRAEAVKAVKSFISSNLSALGVKAGESITFSRVDSSIIYDGSISWHLSSNNQIYDGLEVIDAYLNFNLINGKISYSVGNWFPTIYIPPKINVDEQKTKTILLNKVVYLYDIAGKPIPMTITAKSLETAVLKKSIYPLKTTDRIELHVIWQVNIPDVFYVVFVDVMTGELIGGYPTVYS